MESVPISSICVLLIALAMISQRGQFVEGTGYQTDPSSRAIDNSDNSGPANYRFEYGVDDGSVGQQFGHEEERNGQQTRGRYSVLLPDGRLQVVTYRADENGYHADVTYENGSSGGGYDSASGRSGAGSGGYGYENVQTAASSYGPAGPPTATQRNSANNAFQGGNSKSFGSAGTFVKLRRTVGGKMFNYSY